VFGRNPLELLENPLLVFFADTDAEITDFNPCLIALSLYTFTLDRTLGAVTQGIGQQIGNHLFDTKLVPLAFHRARLRRRTLLRCIDLLR
jgi:hypothetical protein